MIKLVDIEKYVRNGLRKSWILNQVNLEIREGEFVTIMGPSGAGKTTLLNILGMLDSASGGEYHFYDEPAHKLSERKRHDTHKHYMGFVFQAYNLIPVLTARENVEFVMLLQNRSKAERDKRVKELLHAVGLDEKIDKRPSELSGGQQQRVAVARALAPKPTFILADEPTANLDSASTANLLDIMARLNQEENITFVFSTHDQRVIDRARRVVTLEDGVISNEEHR